MDCLFCKSDSQFNTKEHIIPESLGNKDLILEKELCDKCQNYLSQNENYVLSNTPIGFWRTLLRIKTKNGKMPAVDFKKNQQKGFLPDFSEHHDDFGFVAHEDYTTELKLAPNKFIPTDENTSFQLKYVMTPKALFEIGRFLGKIGLELICYDNSIKAREAQFNDIRTYVRGDRIKEIWPIFHENKNYNKEYISRYISTISNKTGEKTPFYTYNLFLIESYIFFKLGLGIDNWFICLNQQFPHPEIGKYVGKNVKTIWYPLKQWKNGTNSI